MPPVLGSTASTPRSFASSLASALLPLGKCTAVCAAPVRQLPTEATVHPAALTRVATCLASPVVRVALSTVTSMSLRLTFGFGFGLGVGDSLAVGVGEGVGVGVGDGVGVGVDVAADGVGSSSGPTITTQPRPSNPATQAAAVRVRNHPGRT